MNPRLLLLVLAACGGEALEPAASSADSSGALPNIVLVMSDDQGFGDIGYHGNDVVKTPHLDRMSREGLRFSRFYAAPLCGPTRATCMTGRHPNRFGIVDSNSGRLPPGEHTLAELLRARGYATGHFGKWHLGTLSQTVKDSRRGGPGGAEFYSPPWESGFEVCFSTEAKVPTWDPMIMPRESEATIWWDAVGDPADAMPFHTDNEPRVAYWNERGEQVTTNLEGDDSRIIMDRVLPFIEDSVEAERPFLAVVWFHAPHKPVVAGPQFAALYEDLEPFRKHYYGSITAMDEQVGRLRASLRELGVERDTVLWFCSDNGPFGEAETHPGSAGDLRGRKGDLREGGIRVPAILEWPARIADGRESAVPVSTLDMVPTLLELTGAAAPADRELDGLSIVPLIDGSWDSRPEPIPFASGSFLALVDNTHKLLSRDSGKTFTLYDIGEDPREKHDLIPTDAAHEERARAYAEHLLAWRKRVRTDFKARRDAGEL